jgi:hypothetical protein
MATGTEGIQNQNVDLSKVVFNDTPVESPPAPNAVNLDTPTPPLTPPVTPAPTTPSANPPVTPPVAPITTPVTPPPIQDEELIEILNKRGITLSKMDELKSVFEESATLKTKVEELSKPKELEFPNDKAKALYEFAKNFDGNEMAAAKTLLNAAELDLKSADPKTIQFEAFCIKYPQLPREEAKAVFDEKYALDYGDGNFEGKAFQKFNHDNATKESLQAIESAVKQFKEAKSPEPLSGPTPEQLEAVKRGIEGALKDFKGSTVQLTEYKTKTGQVVPAGAINVAIKPEEAAQFREFLDNPESLVRDIIGRHQGENGLNWGSYVNEMHQIVNRQQIHASIHSQGIEEGMLIMLNQINNSGGGKLPEGGLPDAKSKSLTEQYESSRRELN